MTVDLAALGGPISAMPPQHLARIASLGVAQRFLAGTRVLTTDDRATEFHIVTAGRLQVGLRDLNGTGIVLQTLAAGDIAGLSWMSPPYRWNWDVTAAVDTDVLTIEAAPVRTLLEGDTALRASLSKVIVAEMHQRLIHARLQLLDLYGMPGGSS